MEVTQAKWKNGTGWQAPESSREDGKIEGVCVWLGPPSSASPFVNMFLHVCKKSSVLSGHETSHTYKYGV